MVNPKHSISNVWRYQNHFMVFKVKRLYKTTAQKAKNATYVFTQGPPIEQQPPGRARAASSPCVGMRGACGIDVAFAFGSRTSLGVHGKCVGLSIEGPQEIQLSRLHWFRWDPGYYRYHVYWRAKPPPLAWYRLLKSRTIASTGNFCKPYTCASFLMLPLDLLRRRRACLLPQQQQQALRGILPGWRQQQR